MKFYASPTIQIVLVTALLPQEALLTLKDPGDTKRDMIPLSALSGLQVSPASSASTAPLQRVSAIYNTMTDEQLRGLDAILEIYPVVQKPST